MRHKFTIKKILAFLIISASLFANSTTPASADIKAECSVSPNVFENVTRGSNTAVTINIKTDKSVKKDWSLSILKDGDNIIFENKDIYKDPTSTTERNITVPVSIPGPGNYTLKITDFTFGGYRCDVENALVACAPEAGACTAAVNSNAGSNPCTSECQTALGNIPTDTTAFAGKVLSIGIGLAGGIALIFMVFGSIKILTSAGDPKKVADGREIIVAAIAGTLFLILSVLILRFIGGTFLPTNPFS